MSLFFYNIFIFVFSISLFLVHPANASNIDGKMYNTVSVSYRVQFLLNGGKIDHFTYRFPLPSGYSYRTVSQKVRRMKVTVKPEPGNIETVRDQYGNTFKVIHWNSVSDNISIDMNFVAVISSAANSTKNRTAYPVRKIRRRPSRYLHISKNTIIETKKAKRIIESLTKRSKTEINAVESILNWIQANIRYRPRTPGASASNTLLRGYGNCEGYSNLTVAMLRQAGIPARVAGGISLSRKWKTPTKRGYMIHDMGQGPHAWVEVYFPNSGWVPYDPQQRTLLFSSRLIKFAHGLDTGDVNSSWTSDSYLPGYSETTQAVFIKDRIDVRLK
ncbi:transglutaminase-like superfamily protein [bacterium BMS3Abin07]|nr:transglutaminase-like superfamily protein [bacterium BMS3Abin07]GBE31494.1 transglutaminase-like superfamily protein [bacterium BMS3Bbin05]HDO23047.1 transglutaminase family protein [Nitrospirota bacterium]HDZ88866.1 transglutaminase family protein [Nitrospirota bacterium]